MNPTREEFKALARSYTVVPVWDELISDLITPVAVFARCVGDEPGFLLESVEHGERWSRYSFVGRRAIATIVSQGGELTVSGDLPPDIPLDDGMLAAMEALLARYRSPSIEGLPPLHGGLIGHLGYDVVREVESLVDVPEDDAGHPDAAMSIIRQIAAIDHWRQRVTLIENVIVPDDATDAELDVLYDQAIAELDGFARDGARPLDEPLVQPPREDDELPTFTSTMSESAYCSAVEVAKEHILAGDIFQVVLSQRFDVELEAEPFDMYRTLRQINPSPYMFFVRQEGLSLVGCSPEPLVQLRDGRVTSRPIAGTRRRGKTDEEDRQLAAELVEHPKERAEHVMLVDLARNDVGRVVEFGSLELDELMTLERYSHVFHMTSQVSGRLAAGRTPIDVLRATIPAGTLSGAPKVRAMEIIDSLEPTKRGPYGGMVGYVDFSGNIDCAIAIRTMVIGPNGASVQAGAGVVADSVPRDEYRECHNKAAALLRAVPAAERMTRTRHARFEETQHEQ